jgi:peptidoglycan lytic transglycosylase G
MLEANGGARRTGEGLPLAKEKKPRPKRRRSSAVVLLNGLLTIVVLAVIVGGAVFFWGVSEIGKPGPKDADTAFLVPKGSGMGALGSALQDQGLISDAMLFKIATVIDAPKDVKVLPGQYLIPAHASISDIIKLITTTKPQEFFVDVIPGETSWEVAQHINDANQTLTGVPIAVPIEGTLLAARHDFFPGDSRQSLVDAMEKKMTETVSDIWADHDPAINDVIKNAHQLVTLASLVEKETGVASERAQVASVFINRLRKHMRLQTDPSVMYGLTQGQGKLDRDLTSKDLAAKTAYNTYQIDGLPPGPIANPSVDALMAVAHPADTNFLYFVAKDADPADGHYFSASYAQHKKNVALYRKAVADTAAEDAKEALEAQQASAAGDTTQ